MILGISFVYLYIEIITDVSSPKVHIGKSFRNRLSPFGQQSINDRGNAKQVHRSPSSNRN